MTRAKRTSLNRKDVLSVTFSALAMVLLATTVATNVPLEARTLPTTPMAHFAESSSSSLSRRDKARVEAMKRRDRRRALKTAASAAAEAHPSARLIRDTVTFTSSTARPVVEYEKASCGDGLVLDKEECDDGNKVSGDGCSSVCKLEKGFKCNLYRQPTVCTSSCGDGLVSSKEECDDGSTMNGDGCNQYCLKEPGYTCDSNEPTVCAEDQECGDDMVQGTEECDDGNTDDNDGCSASCAIEVQE